MSAEAYMMQDAANTLYQASTRNLEVTRYYVEAMSINAEIQQMLIANVILSQKGERVRYNEQEFANCAASLRSVWQNLFMVA